MPNISIIVPVYKVERFLSRCVDSILSQTFSDFALILVDDGSPDNCGALCDAYATQDSRVRVIHQKNGGLSAARNAGIDAALAADDGQWLAFVDSDDWVHPQYLQTLYDAAHKTGCLLSVCDLYRTSGEDFPWNGDVQVQVMEADDFYGAETEEPIATVAWNKLYHRSLFTSLRYPVGKLHEDEFTTYQAVYQAGTVAVVSEKLYAYYQNPEGIMGASWSPKRLHMLEAFEQQAAFAKAENHPRLLKKAAEGYCYSAYGQLEQAEPAYRRELRRKLRRAMKLCREAEVFSGKLEPLWAYEQAYPCKAFWWLYGKMRKGEKT